MNERVKGEQNNPPMRLARKWPALLGGLRVDGPHVAGTAAEPGLPASATPASTELALPDSAAAAPFVIPGANSIELGALNDVGQLAQRLQSQIQSQISQLEGRESAFQLLQAEFQSEQQRLLEETAEQRRQLEALRDEVGAREQVLQDRVSQFESERQQLVTEREAIQLQGIELQQRREQLHHEVLTALQNDRDELELARTTLQVESDRIEELKTSLEKAREELASRNARTLQAERENLWKSLTTEWEQRHESFLQDQDAWQKTKELELAELNREKALFESSVQSANAEFLAAREALSFELNRSRQQHAEALHHERSEWLQIHEKQQASLTAQQEELARERVLIESRIRFQQDHLDKSRSELEQAQNEFRRERQLELTRIEEAEAMLILRLRQIDLYRSSIDEREKSLNREYESFQRTREALTSSADLERQSLRAERDTWEQERQIQQAEIRRQFAALAERGEGMEGRQARLDKLRTELEETHRATLEMRLAVEETWVQLTGSTGPEEARQRVEQVRASLNGHYEQMYERLSEQRRELSELQSRLERQQFEFNEERQKLTAWIATRDQELRLGEERLKQSAADSSTDQASWLAARDRWIMEKAEAEQLIRRLLASLGENNRDQFLDAEAIRHSESALHVTAMPSTSESISPLTPETD